ncbi:hypothetical protein EN12_24520 [Vibrio cholerae]|uniref:Uncharacterized protein n=1 Tax=Vibrio cholerae TaxID=666 RepID=A0A5B1C3R7_VIBCL|nr:hypothetical protein [Vibrio cholerae]AKO78255.1 hypothetical protein EN12_24520 [Vibrio cholerae]KAA1254742.1 hypothetical protein F0M16_10775 [Vibrio cholerae]
MKDLEAINLAKNFIENSMRDVLFQSNSANALNFSANAFGGKRHYGEIIVTDFGNEKNVCIRFLAGNKEHQNGCCELTLPVSGNLSFKTKEKSRLSTVVQYMNSVNS